LLILIIDVGTEGAQWASWSQSLYIRSAPSLDTAIWAPTITETPVALPIALSRVVLYLCNRHRQHVVTCYSLHCRSVSDTTNNKDSCYAYKTFHLIISKLDTICRLTNCFTVVYRDYYPGLQMT